MKSKYNDEKFLREKYEQYGNGRLIAEELGVQKSLVLWYHKIKRLEKT